MATEGGCILVVDDDSTYRFIVERACQKEGLGDWLRLAGTGAEAQSVFQAAAPAVVVVDLNLPDMSGVELLAWIRGQGSYVPVLLSSSNLTASAREEAVRLRVTGFIEKQASFERLRALFRNLFAYWVQQNLGP